jgi:PadR family transcriptional regulator PadR
MPDPQLMKGISPVLVLQAVSTTAKTAPEILDAIVARSGEALAMPQGTLYPLLYRLERQGLLRAAWRDGAGTRRARAYALTSKGTAELTRGRRDCLALASALNLMLGGAT